MAPRFYHLLPVLSLLCSTIATASLTVRYRLPDNIAADTEIGNVATDASIEVSPVQAPNFQLLSDPRDEHVKLLWIHVQSGLLKTRQPVDRDVLCPGKTDCVIEVNVQVRVKPGVVALVKVFLNLQDENDNWPSFEQTRFQITISEASRTGTRLPLPKAADPDSPKYGVLRYDLLNHPEVFSLQQLNDTGSLEIFLVLRKDLDRETVDQYTLDLIAHDGGQPSKSGLTTIVVDVADVNDNGPVFERDMYEVSVREDVSPGTVVLRVKATDRDSSSFGKIIYELDSNSRQRSGSLFGVDRTSGDLVTLGQLDYESATVHTLTVVARDDEGPDAISGQTRVIVRVVNYNDNPPDVRIQAQDATGSDVLHLSESSPPDSVVAWMKVTDADEPPNVKDDRILCSLNDDQFHLQRIFTNEYKIVVAAELDREAHAQLLLTITCQDGGRPPLTGTGNVTVVIDDVNDNPPVFLQSSYSVEVPEDHPVSVPLLAVKATDEDAEDNAEVRYSIARSDGQGGFTIDARTGVIHTREPLDRESQQVVHLIVTATDLGMPPASSSVEVTVFVLDVDDEIPVFSQESYTFTIDENRPANSVIGQIHASDADLPPFNHFLYHLPVSETSQSFRIDAETGILYTTKELDRELKDMERCQVIVCGVMADDRLLSPNCSSAHVTVIILDENDNDPVIVYPLPGETVFIGNRFPGGKEVARIRATDWDSGEAGRVSFRLLNRSQDYFEVNETTGEILTRRDLAALTAESFSLHVKVSDSGSPPRSITALVNLTVNATLSSTSYSQLSIISGQNLVIVIVIASASGLVVVLLSVAIFCLLKSLAARKSYRNRCRKNRTRPYLMDMAVAEVDGRRTAANQRPIPADGFKQVSVGSREPFHFFQNNGRYVDAAADPDTKRKPIWSEGEEFKGGRDSAFKAPLGGKLRRNSLTPQSLDSGRGSSEEVAMKTFNAQEDKSRYHHLPSDSSFQNITEKNAGTASSLGLSSSRPPTLISSRFRLPHSTDRMLPCSHMNPTNNRSLDLLENTRNDEHNSQSISREFASTGSLSNPNFRSLASWNRIINDGKDVRTTPEKERPSGAEDPSPKHPELLVDCNAFSSDTSGSFV